MTRDDVVGGGPLKPLGLWLLLLCLGMAAVGVVLPSPPVEAKEEMIPAAQPVRLIVPTIDLRAPVLPIEMTRAGVLYPPEDVDDVGWWKESAKPGADGGQTLITGHTVSSGGGVMNRLGDLHRGDRIRVRTSQGTVDYRATKVFVYSREQLAKHATGLFGQDRDHNRLVLVTCTDWDGEVYESNTIVLAKPTGSTPATKKAKPSTRATG